MVILEPSGRSRLLVFSFQNFLTVLSSTKFYNNSLLVFKPMASIQITFIDNAVKTLKIWQTFTSASSFLKDFDNPTISRVSLLEYWAFAQHCFSMSTKRKDKSEFAFLVTAMLTSSLSNLSFKSFRSSKTLAMEDSILLWRLKAIPIKSSLLSFLKASSEYNDILENSCSESKAFYLK